MVCSDRRRRVMQRLLFDGVCFVGWLVGWGRRGWGGWGCDTRRLGDDVPKQTRVAPDNANRPAVSRAHLTTPHFITIGIAFKTGDRRINGCSLLPAFLECSGSCGDISWSRQAAQRIPDAPCSDTLTFAWKFSENNDFFYCAYFFQVISNFAFIRPMNTFAAFTPRTLS